MPAPRLFRHPAASLRSSHDAGPVVPATAADLAYVVHLQKRHGDAVGFIPRAALEQKIGLGRIQLATENGEPAGYLHHGSLARPEVRIFQAAVQYDARRRHLGLALVGDLLRRAAEAGAAGVSLRCLSHLEANEFWTAAGFRLVGAEPGAKGTLNVWGIRLGGATARSGAPTPFAFHSRMHPCPGCGRLTNDSWSAGARRYRVCADCLGAKARE